MPIGNTAIVGAGIAGLTAALALARHGIRSEIFEQAEALNEVGAGLQVSPNASRILGELGVLDTLSSVWLEPEDVRLVSGRSLRQIASVPCGSFARRALGSALWHVASSNPSQGVADGRRAQSSLPNSPWQTGEG